MQTLFRASVAALCLCAALPARAASIQEARELVARAVRHVAEVGDKQAFADFNDKSGSFVIGDLYIFVYSFDGVCLAHGGDPSMIGAKRLEVADANGRKFIAEMITIAKEKGAGFVDYLHKNPKTGETLPKVTVFTRPTGKDFVLAAGVYRK
jgi:signal transduction histidine kinase